MDSRVHVFTSITNSWNISFALQQLQWMMRALFRSQGLSHCYCAHIGVSQRVGSGSLLKHNGRDWGPKGWWGDKVLQFVKPKSDNSALENWNFCPYAKDRVKGINCKDLLSLKKLGEGNFGAVYRLHRGMSIIEQVRGAVFKGLCSVPSKSTAESFFHHGINPCIVHNGWVLAKQCVHRSCAVIVDLPTEVVPW